MSTPGAQARRPFLLAWVVYGLPATVWWSTCLLAFWPGIMSDDSVGEWRQLTTLHLLDYDCPLNTLTYWVITRLWLSPAAVAIAQIVGLSLVFAAIIWLNERPSDHPWLRWSTVIAFIFIPANAFLPNTLWKDNPYTIIFLLLVIVSIAIVRTGGEWLARHGRHVVLALILIALALYRHNGLPVAVGYLLFLFVASSRPQRRRVAATAGVVLIGYIFVHWWLFLTVLHAEPTAEILAYQAPIHQVGAIVASGVPLREDDRRLLEQIAPLRQWRETYDCGNAVPLLMIVNDAAFAGHLRSFFHVWARLVTGHPLVLLRHQRCVTGFLWNPLADFTLVPAGNVQNEFGFATNPLSPRLHWWWIRWHVLSTRRPLRILLWDPALHFYVVLAGLMCVGYRRGFGLSILPFVPAVAHTVILLLAVPSREFRLDYPVFVYGLLTPLISVQLIGRNREDLPAPTAHS
jgi:hypothetical protein